MLEGSIAGLEVSKGALEASKDAMDVSMGALAGAMDEMSDARAAMVTSFFEVLMPGDRWKLPTQRC